MSAGMSHLIGHLDADCFYCSAERVRYPFLRGRPLVVIGNQGACCIAKSYEAKAAGVQTGMPIWDAVSLCPGLICVKRDFRWYEVLSRKMLSLLREVSPAVEWYSIDEMFFDATTLTAAFRLPLPQATAALQQRILREVGVPVSIGVTPSKCLSKLASDSRKPFGCTVLLDAGEITSFLADLDVAELWGIGARSSAKLHAAGIRTCREFVEAPRSLILQLLTVKGEGIWWELRGESVLPIVRERPAHQRISRGGSLGGATANPERLRAWVLRNVERLIEELDFHHVLTRQITLSLQFRDNSGVARQARLPIATKDFTVLAPYALALFDAGWPVGTDVGYMHLDADRLTSVGERQQTLFALARDPKTTAIADVKRAINARMGRFALRSGATLPLAELYDDETADYDICDVHGKGCF